MTYYRPPDRLWLPYVGPPTAAAGQKAPIFRSWIVTGRPESGTFTVLSDQVFSGPDSVTTFGR